MAFTVMPLAVHSLAKLLVSCATAPLDAAYAGTATPPWKDRRDAKLMMLPLLPVAGDGSSPSMWAPTSRHSVKMALTLTCTTWARHTIALGQRCAPAGRGGVVKE